MRVFWFGMHKILKPTELAGLRKSGYEVFNPPYRSTVFDQSADLSTDETQPTTLPQDIFDKLFSYNFFYNSIDEEIAEILNNFFDVMIVTINGDWLKSVLEVYHGKVIFRTYGQPYSMSQHLISIGAWALLSERQNFYIMPFAKESIEEEHQWFQDLCTHIIPYQIADDVFEHVNLWSFDKAHSNVSVSIPNIENPYYSEVYHHFVHNFTANYFRILGPQRVLPADPRILGAMSRSRFLDQLASSRAYLYPYTDNVCYLPPIEMMQLGGPVVFMPGSLLARFSDPKSPGGAKNVADANILLSKIMGGDKALVGEILQAQEPVRLRYDRNFVRPLFENAFDELLSQTQKEKDVSINLPIRCKKENNVVLILLHIEGFYHFVSGKAVALEGIPRVVDAIVSALVAQSFEVVLTCTETSRAVMYEFFKKFVVSGDVKLWSVVTHGADRSGSLLKYVEKANSGVVKADTVFIPHYYLFPEALLINIRKVVYLPDYFPYLLPEEVFDESRAKDAQNKRVGNKLGHQARYILTNSKYSASYLAEAGFCDVKDASQKIVVAPLPLLGKRFAHPLPEKERIEMTNSYSECPFLFYPTANRPNKKLAFCLRLVAYLRLLGRPIRLVLTCSLDNVPEVRSAYNNYHLAEWVTLVPGSSEGVLRWFYENCAALCLTSVAEGNLPPQLVEALHYSAPIVATRLPTITEIFDNADDSLLLCEAENLIDFADKTIFALDNREVVLDRQLGLASTLSNTTSGSAFSEKLKQIFAF